jgi:UDP-2,4-diacetamido-2,4,6-trideoxy-beta-L-altropyranose hydrolase
MRVAFRVDASLLLGTGHVMRCLTLAMALRERGVNCAFVSRALPGHLCPLMRERGFEVLELPRVAIPEGLHPTCGDGDARGLPTCSEQDAVETLAMLANRRVDWLIVDHYGLDAVWERRVGTLVRSIVVIDDLADRLHDCEVLLDQNLGRLTADYDALLPPGCERLIGPRYALLRPDFACQRPESLVRRGVGPCRHILVTMGGTDKDDITSKVLAGLEAAGLGDDVRVTVVLGATAPWIDNVQNRAKKMREPTRVLVDVPNMAELMCEADLAIGAAGSTSWERCCMGLPTILLVLAENQRGVADALVHEGVALLANGPDVAAAVRDSVRALWDDACTLTTMSRKAAALVDGQGASRVADCLLGWADVYPAGRA